MQLDVRTDSKGSVTAQGGARGILVHFYYYAETRCAKMVTVVHLTRREHTCDGALGYRAARSWAEEILEMLGVQEVVWKE